MKIYALLMLIFVATTALAVVSSATGNPDRILVDTDKNEYFSGDDVNIAGELVINGEPASGKYASMQITTPEGAKYVADQMLTNDYGYFFATITIPENWNTGVYVVTAFSEGMSTNTTFNLTKCDADNDGHSIPECGGDDFNDKDESEYPGATCERSGYTGSAYDGNGNCVGGTAVSAPSSGGGSSGGGAIFYGGGASSCTPNWTCTEWSECTPSGEQTRVCTDISECNDNEGKPAETQECKYSRVISKTICGDGICNGTESCTSCVYDCGECPKDNATETPVCGDGTCDESENCSTCADDCGECETSNNGSTGGNGLTGLIPGGTAGLFGIAALIIVILAIAFFATRKK